MASSPFLKFALGEATRTVQGFWPVPCLFWLLGRCTGCHPAPSWGHALVAMREGGAVFSLCIPTAPGTVLSGFPRICSCCGSEGMVVRDVTRQCCPRARSARPIVQRRLHPGRALHCCFQTARLRHQGFPGPEPEEDLPQDGAGRGKLELKLNVPVHASTICLCFFHLEFLSSAV